MLGGGRILAQIVELRGKQFADALEHAFGSLTVAVYMMDVAVNALAPRMTEFRPILLETYFAGNEPMASPELVLYLGPGSSSMAAHIALNEAGATFRPVNVSFAAREQREPAFLAVNPLGKVPVLLVDGRPLTEVLAILYFVAHTFPGARLWPFDNRLDEAQALSWMSFIASSVHPARRRGREAAYEVYLGMQQRLGSHAWAVADQFSLADIHLFRLYWRSSASLRFDPADFPALEDHKARMLARPAVKATIAAEAAMGFELPDMGELLPAN